MLPHALALISVLSPAYALMYDVVEAAMSPPAACPNGCAVWSDLASSHNTAVQSTVDLLWASTAAQAAAAAACAMPANFAGQPGSVSIDALGEGFDFSYGPQCYCAGTVAVPTSTSGYCGPPATPTPQEVNLQFGVGENEIVVSFVTFEGGASGASPMVELCSAGTCANVSGTTTVAPAPQQADKLYSFHMVVLPASLPAGSAFTYRVRGGSGAWRGPFAFRTPAAAADASPTYFAMAGDLGIYSYAPFTNLLADLASSTPPSFFLHLGDHAYNMAMAGGQRGDGYMEGWQPVLSQVPIVSVIGNHEKEASPFGTYCPASDNCLSRYLHQFAAHNRTGTASGSGTSLYFSLDVGLVHIVVVDSMYYIGLEDAPTAQLAWLAADLAAAAAPAQRARVPWIIVATHVPMYSSDGDSLSLQTDIEPLLLRYGVDVYASGHDHFYQAAWPVGPHGAVPSKSYVAPRAPVHVLSGAGAAPAFGAERPRAGAYGKDPTAAPAYLRTLINRWSYTRIAALNSSHFRFEQVDNINGTVLDTFTIVQFTHGPFNDTAA